MMKSTNLILSVLLSLFIFLMGCGGEGSKSDEAQNESTQQKTESGLSEFEQEHGIGPVTEEVVLNEVDMELAEKGAQVFETNCSSCHKLNERYIGPPMGDVLDRRSPTYVMNMILNPDGMVKEHPEAKKLMQEYMSPMPNQNLSEEEGRAIVEYLASDLE